MTWWLYGLSLASIGPLAYVTVEHSAQSLRWVGWVWYVEVQLIMLLFAGVGLVILWPFCLAHAWRDAVSPFDKNRRVDCWSWGPLNWVYGNPEDGVSGKYAIVWSNGEQVPYTALPVLQLSHPSLYVAWRAYAWSALRNSCDNLKYWFHWENGPQAEIRGHKIGWWPENGYCVPLL